MYQRLTTKFLSVRSLVWRRLKPYVIWVGKQLGLEVLDKNQTRDFLKNDQLATVSEHQLTLPMVRDAADSTKILFNNTSVRSEPGYVWRVDKGHRGVSLLPCGSLVVDHKLLLTDYTVDAFAGPLSLSNRKPYQAKTLIAPWSQYFERTQSGLTYKRWIIFGGYYDFMMLLATKLCRIKEAIPEDVFAHSIVAYPLLNTTYEQDVLSLLGFRPDQILDSRLHNISFDTCLLGDSSNWSYPNVADLMSLKRNVEDRIRVERTNQNRIYIRRAGRRRLLNEEDLIRLLKQYDFTIIDDIPRSVAEQVSIYKNASFIMGPHGASFTNIVWCRPGTHLFELFNADYVPDYFLYLSRVLGLRYSAYCLGKSVRNTNEFLPSDIIISVPEVEKVLTKTLGNYSNFA